MSGCATAGCEGAPAWPSVRRSKTWCQPCLAAMARDRGYEPAEPLTVRKDRWLLTHIACGHPRHSNLDTVRKAAPMCWHCRSTVGVWEEGKTYLRTPPSTKPLPDSYFQPVRDVFASLDAVLLEDPADGYIGRVLDWACVRCGYISGHTAHDLKETSRQSWYACHQCNQARLRGPQPVILYYSQRGLDLLTSPAREGGEAYDARCRRCGTIRRVSAGTLASGGRPCLHCDGLNMDPRAPHRVYLFHFPSLHVMKTGITNAADDSRLRAHAARGGRLLELLTVRNRAEALLLERTVLDQFRDWPAEMTEEQFPQGGFTECWDERAGRPSLAGMAVAAYFAGRRAPNHRTRSVGSKPATEGPRC